MAKGKKEDRKVLYRAVRFEIKPSKEVESLILVLGDSLRVIYNLALEGRMGAWQAWRMQKQAGIAKPAVKFPTLFDQINVLTAIRQQHEREFGGIQTPRNWQEETLDALDGAFKSFFALSRRGDADARPPRFRQAEYFNELSGRSAFAVKDGWIHFAPNVLGKGNLAFPLPAYCEEQLAKGLAVKKFTLFRDEARLDRPGRYWISLVYEIEKPDELAFEADSAIYLAVGATWLGVLSPDRQEVIKLWRPDKYWKPLADELLEEMKSYSKGSTRWHRRQTAWRKKLRVMAAQQKKNQREVVARLLKLGVHFVVQDMTIRGGMADASKKERGGALGLNWSLQNTGSVARLVAHLDEKAKERGGYVIEHKPTLQAAPGRGQENKIAQAHRLRESLLAQLDAEARVALEISSS